MDPLGPKKSRGAEAVALQGAGEFASGLAGGLGTSYHLLRRRDPHAGLFLEGLFHGKSYLYIYIYIYIWMMTGGTPI